MSRLQSRAQREAAFVKLATDLHTQLEDWYDQDRCEFWRD